MKYTNKLITAFGSGVVAIVAGTSLESPALLGVGFGLSACGASGNYGHDKFEELRNESYQRERLYGKMRKTVSPRKIIFDVINDAVQGKRCFVSDEELFNSAQRNGCDITREELSERVDRVLILNEYPNEFEEKALGSWKLAQRIYD